MTYKTIEEVRSELEAINPELVPKYEINAIETGVQLRRGSTSIVSHSSSYGGDEGLYEIYPDMDGPGFRERYGTSDDVAGWLSLNDAVAIAEATENLVELVKKHF